MRCARRSRSATPSRSRPWPSTRASRSSPFGEVENALGAEFALRDREALLARTVADNERALELVQVQYRVGSVDLRAVEQRQLALLQVRTALLRVQTERLAQRVNLHLALGGSFDDALALPVAAR